MINIFLKNLPFLLFTLSCFLFLISLIITLIEINKKKIKPKNKFILLLKEKFKQIVDFFLKEKSETRVLLELNLKKLDKRLNVYNYVAAKIICLLVVSILSVSIYATNYIYRLHEVLEVAEIKNKDYKSLKKLNFNKILKTGTTEKIVAYLSETENISLSEAQKKAIEIYNVFLKIESYKFNILKLGDSLHIVIPISSFFLTDVILKCLLFLKRKKFEKDLPYLKLTTFLLATMHVPVFEILNYMKDLSPAYKDIIELSLKKYSALGVGSINAINLMQDEVPILSFRKLCLTFRDMLTGDKTKAVQNLEIDLEMEQKENNMHSQMNIDRNSIFAILLIMPVLTLMLFLMLMPLLEYMQSLNAF